MPKYDMVVEEWFSEDFPLKIDQSTNTTKITSCASRWDVLIQVQVQVYISKKFNVACGWFGVCMSVLVFNNANNFVQLDLQIIYNWIS
jgi:hypothetical protein